MFRGFCVFCSIVCCAPVFSAQNSQPIAVFLEFESDPSSATVSAMKQEIGVIMKPAGLLFEYHLMKDRKSGESFTDLVVLKFKGLCQSIQPARYNELGPIVEGAPLAFTVISDGRILPFSDVECDTIRQYIAPKVAAKKLELRDAVLGRALGRVVAHELYHIFAGTTIHSTDGVARSFHTRKELTADEFHFTAHESQVLHDAKTKQPAVSDGVLVEGADVAR